MKKVAVIGSRGFTSFDLMKEELDLLAAPFVLVSGGAKGADSLAELYCDQHGYEKIIFLPEWEKYGRKAGFVRNRLIVEECDLLIAFWDGTSRGTKNSIDAAKSLNKPFKVVLYGQNTLF